MCHPFTNDAGDIAMMHNGDIANFKEHWARLKPNHKFKGYNPAVDWITDSEVAVHMIDDEVKKGAGFDEALRTVMPKLTGQVLLCLISESGARHHLGRQQVAALLPRHRKGRGHVDEQQSAASSQIKDELKKIYSAAEEQPHQAHAGQGGRSDPRPQL